MFRERAASGIASSRARFFVCYSGSPLRNKANRADGLPLALSVTGASANSVAMPFDLREGRGGPSARNLDRTGISAHYLRDATQESGQLLTLTSRPNCTKMQQLTDLNKPRVSRSEKSVLLLGGPFKSLNLIARRQSTTNWRHYITSRPRNYTKQINPMRQHIRRKCAGSPSVRSEPCGRGSEGRNRR